MAISFECIITFRTSRSYRLPWYQFKTRLMKLLPNVGRKRTLVRFWYRLTVFKEREQKICSLSILGAITLSPNFRHCMRTRTEFSVPQNWTTAVICGQGGCAIAIIILSITSDFLLSKHISFTRCAQIRYCECVPRATKKMRNNFKKNDGKKLADTIRRLLRIVAHADYELDHNEFD